MRRQAKASSAGSTTRQANGLGRFFRGAFVGRGAAEGIDGSGATSLARHASASLRAAFIAATLLLALAVLAPSANAARLVELGQFAAEAGGAAGQSQNTEGIAINRTGAGGVDPGDVYAVERVNNRVQQFSKDGDFVRMWGKDVSDEGGTGFEICSAAEESHCQAGSPGSAAGELSLVRGIAIDQETGNVYVAEQANRRVSVFSADGSFQGAFGWEVNSSAPAGELQFCTTATGCKAGPSTAPARERAGAFNSLQDGSLAVDPSSGNLWVGDRGNRRINGFAMTLNGEDEVTSVSFVRALGWNVNAETPGEELQECTIATGCDSGTAGPGAGQLDQIRAIAINPSGEIYVSSTSQECTELTPCRVQAFNPDGTFKEVFGPDFGGEDACQLTWTNGAFGNANPVNGRPKAQVPYGIAIDPGSQHVYVARKIDVNQYDICEFDAGGIALQRSPNTPLASNVTGHPSIASAGENRIYSMDGTEAGTWPIRILGLVPAAPATVLPATDRTASSATLNGEVTVPAPGGQGFDVAYYFEYSDDGLTWARAPIGDAANVGSTVPGTYEVHQEIYDLKPNVTYRVRLVTITSFTTTSEVATFATAKASPEIVLQRPIEVDQSGATLQAAIDASNLPTTYHFEFGSDTSYGTRIPRDHELFAGSGVDPVVVTASREGLEEESVYWFRVVATNAHGTMVGPDQRLETTGANDLPERRAFELVTPADKGPGGIVGGSLTMQGVTNQASETGGSFVYQLAAGLPTSTSGGALRNLATRTGSGWISSQVSPPSLVPPPKKGGAEALFPSEVRFSAPDNNCGFVETYNPLTPDTPPVSVELGVTNLYRWSSEGDFELVTDRVPLNPEVNFTLAVGVYEHVDATPDCRRAFFYSQYEFIPGASGLYEWDDGVLRDAGVLPDGSVSEDIIKLPPTGTGGAIPARAVPGGEADPRGSARWNAASPDGRFFFTATANEGPSSGTPAVFMRGPDGADVTEVSASQTAVPTSGARFEAASANGQRVFFRANYGIADSGSTGQINEECGPYTGETEHNAAPKLEDKHCDLYEYNVETDELISVSADSNPADSIGAAIQGLLAVDDDGSHIYFAALGQLVPGKGSTYFENKAGQLANVYLSHEGQLSYVTTLAERDLLEFTGGGLMRISASWRSATSADGGELLFISSRDLAGWESNAGANAVYMYAADTGRIACVSCRPDGQPSVGKFDSLDVTRLLPGPNLERTTRPRALSVDGRRVFFSSPDVLAPGATSGEVNVYMWREGQVFFLASAEAAGHTAIGEYQGASANGEVAFVATGDQLAPQDRDFISDVYAVRVDGGFPFTADPPECQVNDTVPLEPNQAYCQPVSSPQPRQIDPASSDFKGAGKLGTAPEDPCRARARRASALSKRAKVLHRRAARSGASGNRRASRRFAARSRQAARAARRNSKAAKRCRRGRAAKFNRGGHR